MAWGAARISEQQAREAAGEDAVYYLDIHEGDELDEAQLANWVKQAAALPGFLGPRL